jgi:hypothetical protein
MTAYTVSEVGLIATASGKSELPLYKHIVRRSVSAVTTNKWNRAVETEVTHALVTQATSGAKPSM